MSDLKTDISNKTLGVLLLVLWGLWWVSAPVVDAIDNHTQGVPWFKAEIGITSDGRVSYYRDINRQMRGDWTAVVQIPLRTRDGFRTICDGDGSWTYRVGDSGLLDEPMEFERFTDGCSMPSVPFRLCADYVMEDLKGRRASFGPFCSDLFDPRNR